MKINAKCCKVIGNDSLGSCILHVLLVTQFDSIVLHNPPRQTPEPPIRDYPYTSSCTTGAAGAFLSSTGASYTRVIYADVDKLVDMGTWCGQPHVGTAEPLMTNAFDRCSLERRTAHFTLWCTGVR